MTTSTHSNYGERAGTERDVEPRRGNVIEVVNSYFPTPIVDDLVSDEADDLVAALQVRERLNQSSGEPMRLEDSMRAHGVDPAAFGLSDA